MAATFDEIDELIHSGQHIDMARLLQLTSDGLPDGIRPKVWLELLGLQEFKTLENDIGYSSDQSDYRRIKGEATRFCKSRRLTKDEQNTIEVTVKRYLINHPNVEYQPFMIYLCGTLAKVFSLESICYLAFETLLGRIDAWNMLQDSDQKIANFLMLFRITLPTLYNHFEEEEIDLRDWAGSWFQTLLAKQLNIECISLIDQGTHRLWDTYFSSAEGLNLHTFVCLALLRYFEEDLADLEQSEIQSLLQRLPNLDIEVVVTKAQQLRIDLMEKSLLDF